MYSFPFLLVVFIIVGLVEVNEIIIVFLILFNIYKFFTFEFLFGVTMFSEGLFFSVMSAVTFDYRTKVCITIIYCFQQMYFCIVISEDFDIQTQRLKFFQKNFEGLRDTWFRNIVALDDCFISLNTSNNVIGLNCQDFLQCIRSTILPPEPKPPSHRNAVHQTELYHPEAAV